MGINSFLEAHAKPTKAPKPGAPTATPPFTKTDAEYAQKLHALATRGVGNEADVAKAKLDSFAQRFGLTGARVVEKAERRTTRNPKY